MPRQGLAQASWGPGRAGGVSCPGSKQELCPLLLAMLSQAPSFSAPHPITIATHSAGGTIGADGRACRQDSHPALPVVCSPGTHPGMTSFSVTFCSPLSAPRSRAGKAHDVRSCSQDLSSRTWPSQSPASGPPGRVAVRSIPTPSNCDWCRHEGPWGVPAE